MSKPVTIYSTKTCGFCKAVKEYFDGQGVEYKDIDVGENQDKAREMIEKSGQMGVPVILIGEGEDEQVVVGYDKEKLAEYLGLGQ